MHNFDLTENAERKKSKNEIRFCFHSSVTENCIRLHFLYLPHASTFDNWTSSQERIHTSGETWNQKKKKINQQVCNLLYNVVVITLTTNKFIWSKIMVCLIAMKRCDAMWCERSKEEKMEIEKCTRETIAFVWLRKMKWKMWTNRRSI